ncbi:unnamed protein product [Nesidiocoris tenuis]|uniref:Uncharacterized protein n=1 Tax=Nesidiocoris tenuis TaxID=355587 RepID=A0A6H5H0Y2_9HEMI|nr:unnamed protein product [Nesidiocoris tenuis]
MTGNPPLCHGRQLLLDQACVEIYNADSSHSSKVYNVSSECFKIIFIRLGLLIITYCHLSSGLSIKFHDLTGSSSRQRSGDSSPLVPTPPVDIGKDSHRTASLDVFRGITVALMIFVNNGGGGYSIFHHSPWNGLTFADVVFPWFAWIMGVSLVLSIQSQLRNTISRPRVFVKILLRSLIIISLGIVLNSFKNNNIQRLRIPGILQRLGLAYLIVGTIEAFLMVPQNLITVLQGRAQLVSDVIYGWKQWIIMLCLVTLHTGLVLFVKIDGCPRGYLGPGGLDRNGTAFNCTGGVTGYLDRVIFGANHIYQNPTSRHVYHSTMPFDPEGRNAIFLYVGHIITHQTFPWSWSPIDHTTHSHALWMNLWSTVLWILIAVIMERCQVFITI